MRLRLPAGLRGRILLLLASSIVALLLVELGLRLFLPQQLVHLPPNLWVEDEAGFWRHESNLDLSINTGESTVHLLTNDKGYRIGQSTPFDPEVDILAVGDSFLAALQVDYEETFTARLEKAMSGRLGAVVRVVNTGLNGLTPYEYRQLAAVELDRRDYRALLVFIYSGNDVVLERPTPEEEAASAVPQRAPGQRPMGTRIRALLYPANDYLERRSHAFRFFKERGRFLLIRMGLSAHYFPWVLLTDNAASPAWGVTAAICRDIADLAAERGVPALFVLLPGQYQVDREVSEPYRRAWGISPEAVDIDQPSRLLRQAFAAQGLELIDVTPGMRQVTEREGARLFGPIDPHFSAAGHRVVAELLEPHVVELLGSTP